MVLVAAVAAALYVVLPRLAGLDDTWRRLASGDALWRCAGVLFEIASYGAYVFTFHRLLARHGSRSGWPESCDISFAGVSRMSRAGSVARAKALNTEGIRGPRPSGRGGLSSARSNTVLPRRWARGWWGMSPCVTVKETSPMITRFPMLTVRPETVKTV